MQQQHRSVDRQHRIAIWGSVFSVVLMMLLPEGFSVVNAATTPAQFNAFWQQDSVAAFSHWTLNGVTFNTGTSNLQLTPSKKVLSCSPDDVDDGKANYNASVGLCSGHDPLTAGSYNKGLNYYNGGDFYFATAISPIVTPAHPINLVVVS